LIRIHFGSLDRAGNAEHRLLAKRTLRTTSREVKQLRDMICPEKWGPGRCYHGVLMSLFRSSHARIGLGNPCRAPGCALRHNFVFILPQFLEQSLEAPVAAIAHGNHRVTP